MYQLNAFRPGQFLRQLHVRFHVHAARSSTSASSPIGQGLASFLYGIPSSGNFPINDNLRRANQYWAFYSQDDWKVSQEADVEPRTAI